jgi:hypothetical protein
MDWSVVVTFLSSLAPWVKYIFIGIGAAVVIGTAVDSMIDDKVDGGFMKKVLAVPVLGDFLSFLTRFSPFNIKQ